MSSKCHLLIFSIEAVTNPVVTEDDGKPTIFGGSRAVDHHNEELCAAGAVEEHV